MEYVNKKLQSQYAAITLMTACTASMYLLLTECVIFS